MTRRPRGQAPIRNRRGRQMSGKSVGLGGVWAAASLQLCSFLEFCFTTLMGYDFVIHRVTMAPSYSNEQVEISVTILTHLFVYFWLCWLFIAVHGLSLPGAPVWFPRLLLLWTQALECVGSVAAVHELSCSMEWNRESSQTRRILNHWTTGKSPVTICMIVGAGGAEAGVMSWLFSRRL